MNGPEPERPSILMVEDEPMLLDIASTEFEEAGFAVLRAESAEIAVELLQGSERVDLLFTDIRLPGALDGWALAERARALSPNLPVIYVTGFSHEAPRRVEGSILLMKPYRPSQIVKMMRQLGVG